MSVADPSIRYEKKYDGVLIKVAQLESRKLLVSTNGLIDASHAPLGVPEMRVDPTAPRSLRDVFAEVGGLDLPYKPHRCYMFELMHPELST
eukprot:3433002-Amphidinium_carterae.1